jgi:hypothetical protein
MVKPVEEVETAEWSGIETRGTVMSGWSASVASGSELVGRIHRGGSGGGGLTRDDDENEHHCDHNRLYDLRDSHACGWAGEISRYIR